MVRDAVKNAKRFHVAVAFIADTGLNDAVGLSSFALG